MGRAEIGVVVDPRRRTYPRYSVAVSRSKFRVAMECCRGIPVFDNDRGCCVVFEIGLLKTAHCHFLKT